jgi:uncharacterized membrane protein YphA (DoxX/SURF4 family)
MAIKKDDVRHILTRLAVAQVLIIFGIWEIVQPVYWNSFVPQFVSNFMNINLVVQLHGAFILILGAAILIGAYLRISAALAVLTTLAVIVFLLISSGFSDIIVRDIVIVLAAASLIFDDNMYLRATKSK